MMRTIRRNLVCAATVAVAAAAIVGLTGSTAGAATTFATGDVFAAVGNASVQWRHPDSTLVSTLTDSSGSPFTTGMAFDSSGNLYVTDFSTASVSKFNNAGTLLGTFGSGYSTPESILFDSAGNAYVGDLGQGILKFNSSGTLLHDYAVGRVDWLDLSADQCTILYTDEGPDIHRFNVCTNAAGSDFATGLSGNGFALRIRSDGSVLVAHGDHVSLLNSSGSEIKTYDASGQDGWFALNLDPDGTSFWSADFSTAQIFRFDIASGTVLKSFNTGTGSDTVFGLAVFGEITAARDTTPPSCALTATITGPPKQIQVTVRDTGSGLASIVVTKAVNDTVSIPSFTVGTKNPVVVTATKVDQTQSSTLALRVKDRAGNITNCDPTTTTVVREARGQTLSGIDGSEHYLTIQNGTPGLQDLLARVNGTNFGAHALKAGAERTIDISSALHAGGTNTIQLFGHGTGTADILIWDGNGTV